MGSCRRTRLAQTLLPTLVPWQSAQSTTQDNLRRAADRRRGHPQRWVGPALARSESVLGSGTVPISVRVVRGLLRAYPGHRTVVQGAAGTSGAPPLFVPANRSHQPRRQTDYSSTHRNPASLLPQRPAAGIRTAPEKETHLLQVARNNVRHSTVPCRAIISIFEKRQPGCEDSLPT